MNVEFAYLMASLWAKFTYHIEFGGGMKIFAAGGTVYSGTKFEIRGILKGFDYNWKRRVNVISYK